jgi:hypothetical protein
MQASSGSDDLRPQPPCPFPLPRPPPFPSPPQFPDAWFYSIFLHVFSWYMQIHPGHMILEAREGQRGGAKRRGACALHASFTHTFGRGNQVMGTGTYLEGPDYSAPSPPISPTPLCAPCFAEAEACTHGQPVAGRADSALLRLVRAALLRESVSDGRGRGRKGRGRHITCSSSPCI